MESKVPPLALKVIKHMNEKDPITLIKGDKAPNFTLPAINSDGTEIEIKLNEELVSKKVLLVFYQDDGMPICTNTLNAFSQEHTLLKDAGIAVFGINSNGLGSHKRFQERDCFPFPLISDFHGEVIQSFGLWNADEQKSFRSIVVIDQNQTILHIEPHFNPSNLNAYAAIFETLELTET